MFHASFMVFKKKDPQGKSFLSLPRPERESILNGAVETLSNLLSDYFPEIKTYPSLLDIQFRFHVKGGSFSNIAEYKNGKLIINEWNIGRGFPYKK